MLRRYIKLLKRFPLLTAAIAICYAMVCLKGLHTETYFQSFLLRTLLCGGMAFFLYQISGEKTLVSVYNSTWYVVKVAMGFWIFAAILGVFSFFTVSEDYQMWDNIPKQMISLFLMFIFVGLFEELAFRAVINDAIIYRFRNRKFVFVLSAICCCLVFGICHVIGYELATPLAWAQAIGKTISSGVFGLVLLFIYWKTRNIWACGLVHGIYDFLLSFSLGIYDQTARVSNYIVADEEAMASLFAYGFSTAIELGILIYVYFKIGKKIDYQKIREEW